MEKKKIIKPSIEVLNTDTQDIYTVSTGNEPGDNHGDYDSLSLGSGNNEGSL